jgi:hypothetical protein
VTVYKFTELFSEVSEFEELELAELEELSREVSEIQLEELGNWQLARVIEEIKSKLITLKNTNLPLPFIDIVFFILFSL